MKTKLLQKLRLASMLVVGILFASKIANAQSCASGATFDIGPGASNPTQWIGSPPSYGGAYGIQALVVREGYTLEITNVTIDFVNDGAVTVESGGKLIINNSTLRVHSTCNDWDGIAVEGSPYPYITLPDQYSTYSSTGRTLNIGSAGDPGYVEITNGSVIRDVNGAALASEHGGIINISESTVSNSKIGISISNYDKYSNVDPGNYENACRIYKTTIELNEIYGVNEFANHYAIYLNNVSHIIIESCSLSCNYGNVDNDRGVGIYSNNASFGLTKALARNGTSSSGKDIPQTVSTESNCPLFESGASNSTISDFTYGILADNLSTHSFSLSINHSNLNDNKISMEINEGVLHSIDKVNMSVTSSSYNWNDKTTTNKPGYIMKMVDASKFVIYRCNLKTNFENVIYASVDGCYELHSEIARTVFQNNSGSNSSTGVKNFNDCSGFTLRSNTFETMEYDWIINSGSEVETSQVWDNNCGNIHSIGATYHINNSSGHIIHYFHPTATTLTTTGLIVKHDNGNTTTPLYNEDADCTNHPMIVEEFIDSRINLYPNPTSGIVIFDITNVNGSVVYNVFNMQGKVVETGGLKEGVTTINLSHLSNGLYHLSFCIGQRKFVNRNIVISH
ncbi:T9SS type A sorting domain-containing protein [bacterium]|nr:T9SS type A sorting domain-containing protein [bacterium]